MTQSSIHLYSAVQAIEEVRQVGIRVTHGTVFNTWPTMPILLQHDYSKLTNIIASLYSCPSTAALLQYPEPRSRNKWW